MSDRNFQNEDALVLAWIVMSRCAPKSSVYEKAEKYWSRYADESVRGDRPVNITIKVI